MIKEDPPPQCNSVVTNGEKPSHNCNLAIYEKTLFVVSQWPLISASSDYNEYNDYNDYNDSNDYNDYSDYND